MIENTMVEKAETPIESDGWKELPSWLHMQSFYYKDLVGGGPMIKCAPNKANLVSSRLHTDGGVTYHLPVLDLDMNAHLVPSTTPGHHHLYIDKVMSSEDYAKLLTVLVEVGILQEGIWEKQWVQEGMTAARLPGIKKQKNEKSSGDKSPVIVDNSDTFNIGGILKSSSEKASEYLPAQTTLLPPPGSDLAQYRMLVRTANPGSNQMPINEVIDGYFYFLEKKYQTHVESKVEKKLKEELNELMTAPVNDASEKPDADPWDNSESPF